MKRLTRKEAAAMLCDALATLPCPMPRGYGGWCGVLSDVACLAPQTIKNMAHDGRSILKKKYSNDQRAKVLHSS